MRKHPRFMLVVVLATGLLFAFRKPDKIHPAPQYTGHGSPGYYAADTGRPVRVDSAQICIARFDSLMRAHGFSDKAGQKVNIRITRTSLITTGETFSGQGLLDWLTQTKAAYDAAGKTLMVNVQLGVYTGEYLNTYETNASLRSKNVNRIGIFLIPYDANQGVSGGIHPMGAGSQPPPPGYDVGGIAP